MAVAEVETARQLNPGALRISRPLSTREGRRRLLRTTPGRWQAMTVVLLLALVGSAAVALTVVGSRQRLVQQLTTQTTTALDDSAKLYASLSDADETASRAALECPAGAGRRCAASTCRTCTRSRDCSPGCPPAAPS